MIFASTGACPWSTARSSISGFSASITASTSFLRGPALTSSPASAQGAQPLVLLRALPAGAHYQHEERHERDVRERREEDRDACERERDQVEGGVEQRDRATRGAHPPARAGEEQGEGEVAERGARDAPDQPRPALVALVRERAGEEERPENESQHEQPAVEQHREPAPLQHVREHGQGEHDHEEPRLLEEAEARPVEVEARVATRQRTGQQGGQEGTDAARSGEPGALADVHEKADRSGSLAVIVRRLASPRPAMAALAFGKATSLAEGG